MVDTRDSKSRAKERGGSSPLQGIILNWNKFGSGSRNLGDLLYLMTNEWGVCFKTVRSAPTPRVYASTGIIDSKPLVKCPPVTQKIKYIT